MKKSLLLCCVIFFSSIIFGQTDSLLKWNLRSKKLQDNIYELTASVNVPQGWHIYGTNSSIDGLQPVRFILNYENAQLQDTVQFNKSATEISDPLFDKKKANIFTGEIEVTQQIKITGIIPAHLKGTISASLAKNDEFLQPVQNFDLPLEGGVDASANAQRIKIPSVDFDHPLNDCGAKNNIATGSLWSVFLLGFLGGLIALLTPCVFPMIPVTVSFFIKKSGNKKTAVKNGLIYGLCILLIYILASAPFHLIDGVNSQILNSISTSATLNILFFIIFLVFALSFFGYFEITLPAGIAGKADAKSNLGNIGGIFFMALTLVIVSFSCTGIILGTILGTTAANGPWPLTAAMAGFGSALGLPFALFAVFPHWLKSLPKSGGWLDTVKKILAFVELALAFKFLSNADLVMHWGLLKREVFIGVWILIAIGLTLYLFGILHLPHDVKGMKISTGRKILGVITILFTLYLIPGVTSTKYANLQLLSGFPPPFNYSIYGPENVKGKGLEANAVNDYDKALQLAKDQHKPLLIDFTGWACVNCRKMEENVWTQPDVYNYIKQNFILVSLYVDDRQKLPILNQFTYTNGNITKEIITEGDKWSTFETENFKQSTQPLYVILGNDEKLINNPVGYTPDAVQYLNWLKCGKANFIIQK